MKRFLVILAMLFAVNIQAANWYFSQDGAGIKDGSSVGNAQTAAWFNTSAAGVVSPGDIINISGTITSPLTVGFSGTAGNPITIKWLTGAKLSTNTLPNNSHWLSLDGRSYITLDGNNTGTIELTDNGTLISNGGTHSNANYGITAIWANSSGMNHIVIQNLNVGPLYDRQLTNDTANMSTGVGVGVWYIGSDVVVSNCTFNKCMNTIVCQYAVPATSNLTVVDCTITNFNHGITIGSGGVDNADFDNVVIDKNYFGEGDDFESPIGVDIQLHRNPIFIFGVTANHDTIHHVEIADNTFRTGQVPKSLLAGSGGTFVDECTVFDEHVYNNLAITKAPLAWSGGGGPICVASVNGLLANNTIVVDGAYTNSGDGCTVIGSNSLSLNNIILSGSGFVLDFQMDFSGSGTYAIYGPAFKTNAILSDYNIYNHQTAGAFVVNAYNSNGFITPPGIENSLAAMQSQMGNPENMDVHSSVAAVQLDANYIPLSSDTVAKGKGTNLTALAIALNIPGLLVDRNGNPRPSTGAWDIGAFNAATGGGGGGGGATPLGGRFWLRRN